MVEQGPATIGEKEIKTNYPVEEGLIAGTTKQKGRITHLVPQESFIKGTDRCGI